MGDRYGRRVWSAARFLADLIVHGVKSPRLGARVRCGCKRAPLQWRAARCIQDAWSGVVAMAALSSPGVASATGTGGAVTRVAIGTAAIPAARPATLARARRRSTRRAGTAERASRALRGALATARRTGGGRRLVPRLGPRTGFVTTRFATTAFAARFARTRFATTRFAGTRFARTRFATTRFASTRRTRRAAPRRVRARR